MEFFISAGINWIIEEVRTNAKNTKFRRALLKVFREIARAYKSDPEFLTAAKQEFK